MGGDWTPETYPYLRRYTSLPVLIDMLAHSRVTLVDPAKWTDLNDTAFLAAYKTEKKLKTLVALCFTATGETYHHWNVFASGPAGVCIEFKRPAFLDRLGNDARLRKGIVQYKEIRALDAVPPILEDLPFLKRYPYRDEAEYRLIWEDAGEEGSSKDLDLDPTTISNVYLSPWHPPELRASTADMLMAFPDCGALAIHRTTVLENARWKGHVRNLRRSVEDGSQPDGAT